MGKPTLCLDFDGVLHSYSSGWVEVDFIPDPPVPGAIEFMASERFEIHIFSSRGTGEFGYAGIRAMRTWLRFWCKKWADGHQDKLGRVNSLQAGIQWPKQKPSAFITLDDRAITFTGVWPEVDALLQFKPWNKK